MNKQIRDFLTIATNVERIVTSSMTWETKYDLLFSTKMNNALKATGIRVEWCDPDADYEDDVMAYANAIADKAAELKSPMNVELPYIIRTKTVYTKHYNPDYGNDRVCRCGHTYERHFDTGDNMTDCGCKYCDCYEFEEA